MKEYKIYRHTDVLEFLQDCSNERYDPSQNTRDGDEIFIKNGKHLVGYFNIATGSGFVNKEVKCEH